MGSSTNTFTSPRRYHGILPTRKRPFVSYHSSGVTDRHRSIIIKSFSSIDRELGVARESGLAKRASAGEWWEPFCSSLRSDRGLVSVGRSDKTGVGANARRLPRACIVRDTHLYVIYLPTYLPTYLYAILPTFSRSSRLPTLSHPVQRFSPLLTPFSRLSSFRDPSFHVLSFFFFLFFLSSWEELWSIWYWIFDRCFVTWVWESVGNFFLNRWDISFSALFFFSWIFFYLAI